MLESGKVLDRWQVSLKCYCSMTGSLCNSQATWYCLFLSQSSTWCHFALFCESFLSRVCSVCWAIFAPAVVVACVEAGLLVIFLLFGLFDGWTHSTSPNPFRHPCHGRWQVLNLNKEVTKTIITIVSIQSVTQLKIKRALKTIRLLLELITFVTIIAN